MNANVELISDGRLRLRPLTYSNLFSFFQTLLSTQHDCLFSYMDIIHHDDPPHLLTICHSSEELKVFSWQSLRMFSKQVLKWHHICSLGFCIYLWFFVKVGVQMMREIYHLIRGSQMTWGFTEQKAFQASNPQAFRKWLTLTKRNCRITAPFFAKSLLDSDAQSAAQPSSSTIWGHDQSSVLIPASRFLLWGLSISKAVDDASKWNVIKIAIWPNLNH